MPLLAKCINAAGIKLQFKPCHSPSHSPPQMTVPVRIKFKAFDLLTFGSSSPVNVTTRLAQNIRGPQGSKMQTGALDEQQPGSG